MNEPLPDSSTSFVQWIEGAIRAERMLAPGDHVLVSVSGGPDSVAMLCVFKDLQALWDLQLTVVHINYGWRGCESDEDAAFVQRLSDRLELPCVVRTLKDVQLPKRRRGASQQSWARDVRYGELCHLAAATRAQRIAVGHTADDQAETVLMRLLRGSGTRGLGGMAPVRQRHVIRPLLHVMRAEVIAFLRNRKQEFRMDSSNQSRRYTRNRLRHEVMPLLRKVNPNLVAALSRQAHIARADDEYVEQAAADTYRRMAWEHPVRGVCLSRAEVMALPLALRRRVLRKAGDAVAGVPQSQSFDETEAVVRYVMQGGAGASVTARGVHVTHDGEVIRLWRAPAVFSEHSETVPEPYGVPVPARVTWPLTGQTLTIQQEPRGHCVASTPSMVNIDADALTPSLVLRSWQPGDRFHPLGMGGKRKKLQDFFSDLKVRRERRHTVPLLVAPEGIVWVGGYRLDHRFRITESTCRMLVASLTSAPPVPPCSAVGASSPPMPMENDTFISFHSF